MGRLLSCSTGLASQPEGKEWSKGPLLTLVCGPVFKALDPPCPWRAGFLGGRGVDGRAARAWREAGPKLSFLALWECPGQGTKDHMLDPLLPPRGLCSQSPPVPSFPGLDSSLRLWVGQEEPWAHTALPHSCQEGLAQMKVFHTTNTSQPWARQSCPSIQPPEPASQANCWVKEARRKRVWPESTSMGWIGSATYGDRRQRRSSSACSAAQSCPTLCNAMGGRTPGLPVLHYFPEFAQTQVHCIDDALQPSHPLSSPFSSCSQSLPASGSFSMSQLFVSGGQSIGVWG